MLELRPYQHEAVEAVYDYLRTCDGNPAVVCPTGAGKSLLLSRMASDAVTRWQGRVLILAHVRELLVQTADKLRRTCPELRFGIYSAGLKRRDTQESIILAGIQSVYQRACELDAFDLVLVDEAHLITSDGEGMYRTFLAEAKVVNPQLRVVGFTATPYRLDSGLICGPDRILTEVCYEIGVRELIRDGYLCPLITKAGKAKADTSALHVRGGEFIATEVEDLMDQEALVEAACAEIVAHTRDRRAVLIFASGIQHGCHVQRILQDRHGLECGFVCGDTPSHERDELLARFRGDVAAEELFQDRRPLKYLANVNVLTTGFDAPNIDGVALLRPTLSPGLYYQMVGRGFRLHPGKENCLVLDFGGNVLRHGPVDQVKAPSVGGTNGGNGEGPAKECPECQAVIATGYARCPECGYEFELQRQKHDAQASSAGILSGQVTTTTYTVSDTIYCVHTKRGAGPEASQSLRVDYRIGWHDYKSEWICFEHTGYARQKAEAWWLARSDLPIPATAQEAVDLINELGIREAKTITVRAVAGEEFERIVGYELGERKAVSQEADLAEIPF